MTKVLVLSYSRDGPVAARPAPVATVDELTQFDALPIVGSGTGFLGRHVAQIAAKLLH